MNKKIFDRIKNWYSVLYNRINKSRIERSKRRFDQCYAFVKRINRIIADKGEVGWTHRDYYDYWRYMSEYIGNLAKYKRALLKSRKIDLTMGVVSLLLLPTVCSVCLHAFSFNYPNYLQKEYDVEMMYDEDIDGDGIIIAESPFTYKIVLVSMVIILTTLVYEYNLIGKELEIIEKHIGFLDLDVAYYGTRKYKNIESEKRLLDIRQRAYGYFGISKDEICEYCVLRLESIINSTSLYPYPSYWTEKSPSKDIIRLYSDDLARDTVDDDLSKNLNYILGDDIDFIDYHYEIRFNKT